MINVLNTLQAIKADAAQHLPSLLEAQSLPNFAYYELGYPTDQDALFFCVRFAEQQADNESETLSFTLHIQLPGVSEEDACKYIDGVTAYLHDYFSPLALGFLNKTYSIDITDNFRSGAVEIFYGVTMRRIRDDCEGGF
ncbi:MAG: hypothetical protein LBF77_06600 [Spirochaetaceae bacterium]|jgi:hypothetical protein|nr:hypothetical protein [Spirochaetaceae bacterium]